MGRPVSENRNGIIDAFRGVAILGVLAYHYLVRWAPPLNSKSLYGYEWTYSPLFAYGAYGVELFFVISGLVITMTVLRSANSLEFVVRRFARLYPAFLVVTTSLFVLFSIFDPLHWRVSPADYLANLTMDATDLRRRFVDGAFWSIVVEIKFYAFVALAYAILRRQFWIGVIVIATLAAVADHIFSEIVLSLFVPQYFPLFMIGIAAWLGLFETRWKAAGITLASATILYLSEMARISPYLGPHLFILGIAALMFALLRWAPTLRLAPLAWVGRISYSLYLIHQFLGVTLIHTLKAWGAADLVAAASACAVSIGLAWLSFRYVELPAQRLILRLYHWRPHGRAVSHPDAASAPLH